MTNVNNDEHDSAVAEFEKRMAEVQRLRNEADRVRKELINDIVVKIRTLEKQLLSLGYDEYERTPKGRRKGGAAEDASQGSDAEAMTLSSGKKRRKSRGGFGAKTFSEAYCAVCELQGHDLRAHRGQTQKRKFTEKQLQEKGLLL